MKVVIEMDDKILEKIIKKMQKQLSPDILSDDAYIEQVKERIKLKIKSRLEINKMQNNSIDYEKPLSDELYNIIQESLEN
jgi:non-homologous end joining protein Ku